MRRLLRSPLHVVGRVPSLARALPPRARRWLAIAGLASLILFGAWLGLRDSSLVSVTRITVSGLSGEQAPQIEAALTGAARGMSTLHVDMRRLRSAVTPYHVVKDLRVTTRFPHGMRIRVFERLPVAVLMQRDQRLPLAADGTILAGAPAPASLPMLRSASALSGSRVGDPRLLEELTLLGAAPVVLRARVVRVFAGSAGLTAALRAGPSLYFGDASRPRAKWLSAARVLADPSSAGAGYIDVRLPERPAASVAATAVSGWASSATATPGLGDPSSQALAAALSPRGATTPTGAGAPVRAASPADPAPSAPSTPVGGGAPPALTAPGGGGVAQP